MLLRVQSSLQSNQHVLLSSTFSYSLFLQTPKSFRVHRTHNGNNYKKQSIGCSISQVHNYGMVDYETKPVFKWKALFKKISLMKNPDAGCASLLNQWERDSKKLTKWELSRIVKELRKFRRFKAALEVYEWMNDRGERFRLSASDAAIQLDLIAKVHGIASAEDFFLRLPDTLKDKRIYGALLNAYGQARMREKAESIMDRMRTKGYAMHALPFNVMMTLYMNLKEFGRVDLLVEEMMEKNVPLDIYSYNIWLSSAGAQGSAERIEQVFKQMELDRTINPNWTTYSTMATMYIKLGQFEKANECLNKAETRITGRDRMPYHYLISLYGSMGKPEEVYRVWTSYKSLFPNIPNLGYHSMVSSLVRAGDIGGAKDIYEEWLSVKTTYDPRMANLFINWYVKQGDVDKAKSFLDHMFEVGGKPNCSTWEILGEGHVQEKKIAEALSCFQKAASVEGSWTWRPRPLNVSAFLNLCEQENDTASKDVFLGLLRQIGCLNDKSYVSLIGANSVPVSELSEETDSAENDLNDDNNDTAELLFNQLQGGPVTNVMYPSSLCPSWGQQHCGVVLVSLITFGITIGIAVISDH
ncbi:Pentatricopeptide repeat [Dillenia turbinata]|uniref:Pentatricopeptide repeat n=1 Tax=Dillenia turbinata TaxID=194707 RepID=A0AAN8UVZ4_9MAGN